MFASWAVQGNVTSMHGRVRYGTDPTALEFSAVNTSVTMITQTENMATYVQAPSMTHPLMFVFLEGVELNEHWWSYTDHPNTG